MISHILKLEGLFVLLISIYFYFFNLQFSWIIFILLLLLPDLSMLGYLINNKIGAIGYNFFHTYSISLIILLLSVLFPSDILLMIGLTWVSHIGMDKMFGLGLKYPTTFQDTHFRHI